ncbi:hypothetical protein Dimus_012385 [Dionaea muscipula]
MIIVNSVFLFQASPPLLHCSDRLGPSRPPPSGSSSGVWFCRGLRVREARPGQELELNDNRNHRAGIRINGKAISSKASWGPPRPGNKSKS